jgi:hypothetical protein
MDSVCPACVLDFRKDFGKLLSRFFADGESLMTFAPRFFAIHTAVALVAGTCVMAGPFASMTASAASIELAKFPCAKFQSADRAQVDIIMAWMEGYYRTENDPMVIDTDKLAAEAKKLGQYCATHPKSDLISAGDDLFVK